MDEVDAASDQAPGKVDAQRAGLDDRRWGFAGMRSLAQGRAQPGAQFADPERLFDIVVGARVQRLDLLGFAVPGPKDDDRPAVEPPGPDQPPASLPSPPAQGR